MKNETANVSLGIDVGSTSVKACLLRDGKLEWAAVQAHEGNLPDTLRQILRSRHVPPGTPTLVTGQEGRRHVAVGNIIPPVAIEAALGALGASVDAVVSAGGEDLVVYAVDPGGRIVTTSSGSKCACGTGEFFAQQLKRMDLGLDAVATQQVADGHVCKLSSRCSVFMKSDCTHKLNKGEANKHDIVLSLSNVMAAKILELVGKSRATKGRVLLTGGPTRNPHLVRFVREGLPEATVLVPEEAAYLEAFGAAHLAARQGEPLPALEALLREAAIVYPTGRPLSEAASKVTFAAPRRAAIRAGGEYVLGVDGGSTTTKVALIDARTKEIVASHYGRTLGDPVAALKRCLEIVRTEIHAATGGQGVSIKMVSTTGSSRELLGVFCGTEAVYNEIIAHTAGTTFFDSEIDTIFEIGGQDAKYVHLSNRVPVDYAMNEACSAGTGSFLEESAAGDLDVKRAEEIGPLALQADAPLRFGEHCSAFINSDIRKAIQQGATRPNIVAGLVLSIVANYLNRVVGNRRVGNRIVLQGGVAKNQAIPLAFALLLDKPVLVPPDPELMGSFGVGLLAIDKLEKGELQAASWSLDDLIGREIEYDKEYRCKACDNYCPIRILRVGDKRYHFGGRCNKYANLRRRPVATDGVIDYVEVRHQLYFERYAPAAEELLKGRFPVTVAVPNAFSVHSLWPLYANFFHALGARLKLVTESDEAGAARCESSFCYPAEIAHKQAATMLKTGADFYFLPHFKAMPSLERDVHACLCPIMQGLPYYLRTAFGIEDGRILRPVLDFTDGFEGGKQPMVDVAVRLGFTADDAERAYSLAVERQRSCMGESQRIGKKALEDAKTAGRPVIALLGRPYNAFAADANMGIPRKFTTRGCTVLPYDMMPAANESITANMYWYYGQQDLKAAVLAKQHPNVFACMVTNFSCAPDSFILHYLRWVFRSKPFLVLELDSHTADAGIDTRIEAFLDIIEGYRRTRSTAGEERPTRDWDVVLKDGGAEVVNRHTGERRGLKDPKVRLIWPSMGGFATELTSQIAKSYGIDSVALPPADVRTAARARAVASGKECIPALLVLGAFLRHFAENPIDRDRVYLLFMPLTTGPCRTGQYAIYYQGLFEELGYRNVVVLSLNSDNSYSELGGEFNKRTWWAVLLSDYMRDVETSLRALAAHPASAQAEFNAICKEMLDVAGQGSGPLIDKLPAWAQRLGRIPLRQKLADARKVIVAGEIFVRRDDYSADTLLTLLAEKGIVAKVTGLSEWIHYLDWDQVRRFRKKLAAMPRSKWLLAPETRKLAWLHVEMLWKRWTEHKVRTALEPSGLVPPCPHGMDRIMGRAEEFTTPELESEASLSPCVAAEAMEQGYDGVAIIAPFACLPGRLIEALYVPWARARGLPVISLENDGNPYPPSVVGRIEIFAHNVGRGIRGFQPKKEAAAPAEATPAKTSTAVFFAPRRTGEAEPEQNKRARPSA